MPRLITRTPRLCRDRQQAYVKIDGCRVQLGICGTAEAREAYDRTVAAWLSNGRRLPHPTTDTEAMTVTEVCIACWRTVKDRQPPHAMHRRPRQTARTAAPVRGPCCAEGRG